MAAAVVSIGTAAVAAPAGSDQPGMNFGSVTAGEMTGSRVFAGASTGVEVACEAAIAGAEVLAAEPPAAGCSQFVQKGFPASSLAPQVVQNVVSEGVAGADSIADGGVVAVTTETASAPGAGEAFIRLPHSVQKAEPGPASTPQEEQTGRVTVTAAEGCVAAGIGLPHDVQKLADSST